MRKIVLLAVLFVVSTEAEAQTDYPSSEIFAGYSYMSADYADRTGLHGWGFSFAGNLGPRWGLVSEFGGNYGKTEFTAPPATPLELDTTVYTFLFGPRISSRSDGATVFGHVLVGGARVKFEGFGSGTDFAMAIGGGVDINAGNSFAIRAIQADYMPVKSGDWVSNFRIQSGIVIKLGQ